MPDCPAIFPLPWWAILLAIFVLWLVYNAGMHAGVKWSTEILDAIDAGSRATPEKNRANEL